MQYSLFPDDKKARSAQPPALDYDSLNDSQRQAVTHGSGPVLVIAGAGSGKTRTLVYRMAHLIEQNIAPESILLLTFTRRSAQEMLQRASRLTDQSCRRVVGGTFHATANMLLRQHGHHLGFGAGFTIIDRSDAEGIINLLKSSLGFSGAGKRFPSKRMIMNLLSGSVNKVIPLEDIVYQSHPHLIEFVDDLHRIQEEYFQFKFNHALMDYDDLLTNWQRLLKESKAAREEITARFNHILVDEYQDTNLTQAAIVRSMANLHNNVMVVGDDAQSIYSFRGADFHNIMRFPEQFPGTSIVKLEENYRSTQPILSLTNSIIAQAQEKFTKTLFTKSEGGQKPVIYPAKNEGGEARFIVETIKKLQKDDIPLNEIAVLFRSGFHSYKLEMELTSHGFDYEKRGGLKLTESAHIKDVLSFFRVLVNPWDHLSWNRILLQLDKVGPKTAQKILASIQNSDEPIAELTKYRPAPAWKKGFEALLTLLGKQLQKGLTPSAHFDLIMEYYEPIFEKIYYDDYPKRKKELDQIQSLISGYGDLQSFIDDTALDPPELDKTEGDDNSSQKLILTTIHSAKGLEWDTVFVLGLAEGRFPHQNSTPGEQWEEERRLLYVAATRAKKQVYLTYPRELMTPDRKFKRADMSPFLREISPGKYELKQETSSFSNSVFTNRSSGSGFHSSGMKKQKRQADEELYPGMTVRHPFFGPGQVKNIPGPRRVEVSFDRHGDKILHLDYANLEIVS